MKPIDVAPWLSLGVLAGIGLGCNLPSPPAEPPPGAAADLPPAYLRNQITDAGLRAVAKEFTEWALAQRAGDQAVYGRVEVLPPAQTVQPYGVGAYQQEPRLPVILTTGPSWDRLKAREKEARAAEAFHHMEGLLKGLKHDPPLRPTLAVQTPEGMELGWINRLDPGGTNLHGIKD
jgi:hypothetical protein